MSTAVATAPVTTTRQEVEDLIHAYVQCIDDDRLEEWPDFFTDPCLYKVIPRENADAGLPVAVMFCDSKGMLRDRIVALRKANIYAPHFYRHLVSNTRILGEQGGVITAQTNYGVFQTLLDGETRVYNTGKYVDKIVRAEPLMAMANGRFKCPANDDDDDDDGADYDHRLDGDGDDDDEIDIDNRSESDGSSLMNNSVASSSLRINSND